MKISPQTSNHGRTVTTIGNMLVTPVCERMEPKRTLKELFSQRYAHNMDNKHESQRDIEV